MANTDIENALIKKFGNVFIEAEEIREDPLKVIPTTPQLDIILGGGVPEGSFMLISGPPKLGKSSLALHIASKAQKVPWEIKKNGKIIDSGDRKVYYFDIEGRIKKRDLYSNKNLNLDPDRFQLIKSSVDKLLVGEEFVAIGEDLVRNQRGGIFIFDSFSALCTQDRMESDISKKHRDGTALLLSAFCKKIAQVIPVNKSLVMGITHRIANQGPGMSQWTEASGQKVQYQADVKLKGLYTSDWEAANERIGQLVHWQCDTSALAGPGQKTTCKLRYQYGYDESAELVELCCDLNIIKKAGAWVSYSHPKDDTERPFIKDFKFQGLEKCVQHFKDNPDVQEIFRTVISKEMGFSDTHEILV